MRALYLSLTCKVFRMMQFNKTVTIKNTHTTKNDETREISTIIFGKLKKIWKKVINLV